MRKSKQERLSNLMDVLGDMHINDFALMHKKRSNLVTRFEEQFKHQELSAIICAVSPVPAFRHSEA